MGRGWEERERGDGGSEGGRKGGTEGRRDGGSNGRTGVVFVVIRVGLQ